MTIILIMILIHKNHKELDQNHMIYLIINYNFLAIIKINKNLDLTKLNIIKFSNYSIFKKIKPNN